MDQNERGILFVHGIGDQPEGATLREFGEPLVAWVRDWLARSPGASGAIEVVQAELTPSKDRSDDPPHCRVRVCYEANGVRVDETWLMAESWWGGDVQAPAFGKFSGWLLTIGAWTILSHFTKPRGKIRSRSLRVAADSAAVALAIVLAMLFQLLVLAVSVLALLPIPAVRGALSAFLLKITGVLGDAYVLVESEMQRAVLVNRTRTALGWVVQNARDVTVIAHSQGAAIAHQALREPEPANVQTLLTFGSGIGKLNELSRTKQGTDRVRRVARLIPLTVLFLALTIYVAFFEQRSDVTGISAMMLGFASFLIAVTIFIWTQKHWEQFGERLAALSLKSARPELTWLDVYASRDPVPNGPLAPRGVPADDMTSQSVVNLRSLWLDHTSYWQNKVEFLPIAAAAIQPALFSLDDSRRLAQAATEHRRTAMWLSVTRLATLIAVPVIFWLHWDSLGTTGRTLAAAVTRAPDFIGKFLGGIGSVVTFILSAVPLVGDTSQQVGVVLLGATLPLAMIAAWRYGYGRLWRWWDRLALRRAITPGLYGAPVDRHTINVVVVLAGLAPLITIIALPQIRGVRLGFLVMLVLAALMALMVAFGARNAVIEFKRLPAMGDATYIDKRKELTGQLIGLATLIVVSVFLFSQMVPGAARIKEIGSGSVIVFLLASMVVKFSMAVHRSIGVLTTRRWISYATLGLVAIAPLALIGLPYWLGAGHSPAPSSEQPITVMLQMLGMYLLLLGATHLVVGWRGRSRARSVPPPSPAESA